MLSRTKSRIMSSAIALISTLMLASLILPSFTAQAVDYSPVAPFVKLGNGHDSVAVTDANGAIHIVWINLNSKLEEVVYANGKVQTTKALPLDYEFVQQINGRLAATTSNNRLHLFYTQLQTVCYASRPLNNFEWSQPDCTFVSGATPLSSPNIAALPDGRLAFAWQAGGQMKIAVRGLDNHISYLPDPGDQRYGRYRPYLLATGSQNLTIMWEQGHEPGPGGSYRSELLGSEWLGNNWSTPVSISGYTNDTFNPWTVGGLSAVVAPDGTLHLAYVLFAPDPQYIGMPYRLYYKRGTLNNLSAGEMVAGNVSSPSLAVSGNRIELAWVAGVGTRIINFRIENQEILWSRRGDNGWSSPVNISYTAGSSYNPLLFIAPDGESRALWSECNGNLCYGETLLAQTVSKGQAWGHRAETDSAALYDYTRRADGPLMDGLASRSWLWGPKNWFTTSEEYIEAPEGKRVVNYYDKARIEVNDPNKLSSDPYYFTGGLLVTEMVSGRIQYGDGFFLGSYPNTIQVAGDYYNNADAPSYASFKKLIYVPESGQADKAPNLTARIIHECLNKDGMVVRCSSPSVANAAYISETGHNIAAPFWNYLNQSGIVYRNGQAVQEKLFDWVATMGFPISEPLWVKTKVGGVDQTVLVQLFQRRTLTYTPSNPTGFQVEMGNVGQHYYYWRYGGQNIPWLTNKS